MIVKFVVSFVVLSLIIWGLLVGSKYAIIKARYHSRVPYIFTGVLAAAAIVLFFIVQLF